MSSMPKIYRGSEVGDVSPYFGAVLTITSFCRNRMDRPSATSFSRLIRGKETFSSADADEGRRSTILTSRTISTTFRYRRCRISQVSWGKLWVADSCRQSMKKIEWYPKKKMFIDFLGCVECSTNGDSLGECKISDSSLLPTHNFSSTYLHIL
jgi:hypothetical protein